MTKASTFRLSIAIFIGILLLLVVPMLGRANADSSDATISSEYMTDSDGYDFGISYYIDNNIGVDLYVIVCIQSKENVDGDVVHGVIILNPNETYVRLGSFVSADLKKPWSAHIRAYWARDPKDLPYIPGCN